MKNCLTIAIVSDGIRSIGHAFNGEFHIYVA